MLRWGGAPRGRALWAASKTNSVILVAGAVQEASEQASTAADGDEEADEDEDDYSAVDTSAGFFCDTIVAEGLPKGVGVPTEVRLGPAASRARGPRTPRTAFTVAGIMQHCLAGGFNGGRLLGSGGPTASWCWML